MSIDLHERIARVETRLDGIAQQQDGMAADLRVVRDYILTEKGAKGSAKRLWVTVLAVISAGAAFWGSFGGYFKRFTI